MLWKIWEIIKDGVRIKLSETASAIKGNRNGMNNGVEGEQFLCETTVYVRTKIECILLLLTDFAVK